MPPDRLAPVLDADRDRVLSIAASIAFNGAGIALALLFLVPVTALTTRLAKALIA